MTAKPARIVDAHVHLWDPARTDWYPYLSGRQRLDMGDVSGMARRFDVPTYRAESTGWNVEMLVNVAAANQTTDAQTNCASLDRVEPNDPDNSVLVRKISGTTCGTRMPATTPTHFANNPDQLIRIRSWIMGGALNN